MKIRIATRRSKLALAQTRWVAHQLCMSNPGLETEEVQIVTEGDRVLDKPLAEIGGKGLFVSEVEAAIADGRADIAVHSMKDVPADLASGMTIACIPKREDPHDVIVSKDGIEIDDFPAASRIGTGSLRRGCQLLAHRPDIAIEPIRGNVDTRLRKLDEGLFDGVVLAAAGLRRLNLDDRPLWSIPFPICLPAAGQGALALEGRENDEAVRRVLATLEDTDTRITVEAERALLFRFGGDCHVPIAGFARLGDGRLRVDGMVGKLNGTKIISAGSDIYMPTNSDPIEAAKALGIEVADNLIAQGARELLH